MTSRLKALDGCLSHH